MAPTAPPFFPPGANGAPFSSVSARFRNTRRYTNVVCCPDMLTANVSPRTRGPWRGMLPPTLSIVSDPSTPQAELLALLAVPHSAMSVGAAWNRVATSVWWPLWCFGAGPLEVGLGTRNSRFFAWPLGLGLGTHATFFRVFLGKCSMGRFPLQNISKASMVPKPKPVCAET